LIDRYLIPYILYLMPNVIASDKRSVTYLENLTVHDWMAEEAAARNTDVSTILREATSAYFAQWASGTAAPSQFAARAAAKVARRAETARLISSGKLTSEAAQDRNAPIRQSVSIVNLWPAVRRRDRRQPA